jgi:hypothetical protein
MKKAMFCSALFVFLLAAFALHAAVDVVLFEETYTRETGTPKTVSRTFAGYSGTAVIKLWNGGATDATNERVSSSVIAVNGTPVFEQSNFNQNVTYLERTITLDQGSNTIDVILYSKPGGTIRIEILQTVDVLYADFGSSGTWMWNQNDTTWTKLSPSNPENMVASGLFLYADFGPSGIWMWNGSNWTKLTPSDPENIVASGSLLYADFGPGGIWMWNGSNWSSLTPSDPQKMVASGSLLYADFGSGGLWLWDGSNWSKLTPSDPESMVVPF